MTTTRYEQQERTIHAALTGSGGKVVRVDRGVWEFYPDRPDLPDLPGEFAPVEVRLRDNWVLCCSPVPSGLNGDLEGYALAMPALPGRCKVILDPADMTPRLREEILSVEGVDLAGACGSAIANLASAGALITRPNECRETRSGSMSAVPDEIVETLAEVSDASGWTFTEYGDGEDKEIVLAASQRSGGGGGHAVVEAHGEHGVRITAGLSRHSGLSSAGRRAAAALVLTANGLMRLVRAGFDPAAASEGNTHAFLETWFTRPPSRPALAFALSTFAAAVNMFDSELGVMADESLARRYLEARGLQSQVDAAEAVAS